MRPLFTFSEIDYIEQRLEATLRDFLVNDEWGIRASRTDRHDYVVAWAIVQFGSLQGAAKFCGVTGERVRQIRARVVRKLIVRGEPDLADFILRSRKPERQGHIGRPWWN
jgi:DNA-directed RNA polymerase sigma subunit (sigma70/sigma32)